MSKSIHWIKSYGCFKFHDSWFVQCQLICTVSADLYMQSWFDITANTLLILPEDQFKDCCFDCLLLCGWDFLEWKLNTEAWFRMTIVLSLSLISSCYAMDCKFQNFTMLFNYGWILVLWLDLKIIHTVFNFRLDFCIVVILYKLFQQWVWGTMSVRDGQTELIHEILWI